MSRWLTAKTKDEFIGQVLWDLRDRKITREDPDFMEALKAAIEFKGIERANELVIDKIATQDEVDEAVKELKQIYGYPNE